MNSPNAEEVKKTVVVELVVEMAGSASRVTIISSPEDRAYRDETIRILKKSNGYWMPAVNNGRHVRSYKTVAFDF